MVATAAAARPPLAILNRLCHLRALLPHTRKHPLGNYDEAPCPVHDAIDGHWHARVYDDGVVCPKDVGLTAEERSRRGGHSWSPFLWLRDVEGLSTAQAMQAIAASCDGDAVALALADYDGAPPAPPGERPPDPLDPATVARLTAFAHQAHAALDDEGRAWWHDRGVSDRAIDRFALGALDAWYTIPLADESGNVFAVKRRWRTAEPPADVPRYAAVTGSRTAWAPWLLGEPAASEVCVVVGGEIKALVLWSAIADAALPWCVATTAGGEGAWRASWSARLAAPRVAIWPDRDAAGLRFVHAVRAGKLSRAVPIVPTDYPDAKAVDDYLLAGGNPLGQIAGALHWKGH